MREYVSLFLTPATERPARESPAGTTERAAKEPPAGERGAETNTGMLADSHDSCMTLYRFGINQAESNQAESFMLQCNGRSAPPGRESSRPGPRRLHPRFTCSDRSATSCGVLTALTARSIAASRQARYLPTCDTARENSPWQTWLAATEMRW